jgi:preprotein translocase subunit SecA
VLQYDDVMNMQREIIYGQRQRVLNGDDVHEYVVKMVDDLAEIIVKRFTAEHDAAENWNMAGLTDFAESLFAPKGALSFTEEEIRGLSREYLTETLQEIGRTQYARREQEFGPELMRELERVALLQVVDSKWMDHIDAMDQLKSGINLRAYGQKDPVIEYKFEGFEMFEEMIDSIREDTVRFVFHARIGAQPKREMVAEPIMASHGGEAANRTVRKAEKVGRNDPCPCGSGKKYKKCCGMDAE